MNTPNNDPDSPFNTCKECGGGVASELDDTCLDCRWDDYDNDDNEDE